MRNPNCLTSLFDRKKLFGLLIFCKKVRSCEDDGRLLFQIVDDVSHWEVIGRSLCCYWDRPPRLSLENSPSRSTSVGMSGCFHLVQVMYGGVKGEVSGVSSAPFQFLSRSSVNKQGNGRGAGRPAGIKIKFWGFIKRGQSGCRGGENGG